MSSYGGATGGRGQKPIENDPYAWPEEESTAVPDTNRTKRGLIGMNGNEGFLGTAQPNRKLFAYMPRKPKNKAKNQKVVSDSESDDGYGAVVASGIAADDSDSSDDGGAKISSTPTTPQAQVNNSNGSRPGNGWNTPNRASATNRPYPNASVRLTNKQPVMDYSHYRKSKKEKQKREKENAKRAVSEMSIASELLSRANSGTSIVNLDNTLVNNWTTIPRKLSNKLSKYDKYKTIDITDMVAATGNAIARQNKNNDSEKKEVVSRWDEGIAAVTSGWEKEGPQKYLSRGSSASGFGSSISSFSDAGYLDGEDEEEFVFEEAMEEFINERLDKMLNLNTEINLVSESVKKEEVCPVCAIVPKLWAVGPCKHPICANCSVRIRALYKCKECVMCDVDMPKILFTSNQLFLNGMGEDEYEAKYNNLDIEVVVDIHNEEEGNMESDTYKVVKAKKISFNHTKKKDSKLGIYFEKVIDYKTAMRLLRFNCPNCDEYFTGGFDDLKNHVKEAHGLNFCQLCFKKAKVFTHEQFLYTKAQLKQHMTDENGCPEVDIRFKTHPICTYCNKAFYDSEHLISHCDKSYMQCDRCIDAGIQHQYFENEKTLYHHGIMKHVVCRQPDCRDKKEAIFATQYEMKKHGSEVHGIKFDEAAPAVLPQAVNRGYFRSRKDKVEKNRIPKFVKTIEANGSQFSWPVKPGEEPSDSSSQDNYRPAVKKTRRRNI